MRILVLGGTAWLGHEIGRAAVSAGHDVTCLARGAAVPDGVTLVQADRDDDAALAVLAGSRWDAVIDVARQPGQVTRAVRDLEAVTGKYLFVSTGNVYSSQEQVGADEDAPRLEPLAAESFESPDDYGAAKVACEDAILGGFGADRSLIARAGLIGGPGDPSGRTGYWPWRFAHPSNAGGTVLAPDAPELPVGIIDARDLAAWLIRCVELGTTGIFNAMGTPVPLPEHLRIAQAVAGHTGDVRFAPDAWLQQQGVQEWVGPRSLPLWLHDRSWYGFNGRSNARALAAGLELRPLAETLADVLTEWQSRGAGVELKAGLTDAEERELLALLG